jgi:hypothetical protein
LGRQRLTRLVEKQTAYKRGEITSKDSFIGSSSFRPIPDTIHSCTLDQEILFFLRREVSLYGRVIFNRMPQRTLKSS